MTEADFVAHAEAVIKRLPEDALAPRLAFSCIIDEYERLRREVASLRQFERGIRLAVGRLDLERGAPATLVPQRLSLVPSGPGGAA